MNILVPDIWLRDFLDTKATPENIKEYVSLCGPSIERIYGKGKETVYDIEVTGNRPDAMSVMGVAREAATILPRFGIPATFTNNPYATSVTFPKGAKKLSLTVHTDPTLNPRWTTVIFDGVTVAQSPAWMKKYLELSGLRSLNNVVDITNFLMRAYGQPAHVFDYDRIAKHTMRLRESKKGESLKTLDGKTHTLPGGDIVIEDGNGTLIDLCGIMGGENSCVIANTKRVVLFLQTYDPVHIRKTSMSLAHRTEAAALFEKATDTELVKPVMMRGIELMSELTGGTMSSPILDIYPNPYKAPVVKAAMNKVRAYIGDIDQKTIHTVLTSLGFKTTVTASSVSVTVPSFRRDVTIDVDVIEEIARIHGYHEIVAALPDNAPPTTQQDPMLLWEDEIKIRLRDYGYTELYTYSMLSSDELAAWDIDPKNTYTLSNPLSAEWVYMRPELYPSVLSAVKRNSTTSKHQRVFELSLRYVHRKGELPVERPTLVVAYTGEHFLEAKGLAETLFALFGIPFPLYDEQAPRPTWASQAYLSLGSYGFVCQLTHEQLHTLSIPESVTLLQLSFDRLVADAKNAKTYVPVSKHPPSVEDLAFIVPKHFAIGPLIHTLRTAHELVSNVELLDVHNDIRTLHITYQHPDRSLTSDEIVPAREALLRAAKDTYGIEIKE